MDHGKQQILAWSLPQAKSWFGHPVPLPFISVSCVFQQMVFTHFNYLFILPDTSSLCPNLIRSELFDHYGKSLCSVFLLKMNIGWYIITRFFNLQISKSVSVLKILFWSGSRPIFLDTGPGMLSFYPTHPKWAWSSNTETMCSQLRTLPLPFHQNYSARSNAVTPSCHWPFARSNLATPTDSKGGYSDNVQRPECIASSTTIMADIGKHQKKQCIVSKKSVMCGGIIIHC